MSAITIEGLTTLVDELSYTTWRDDYLIADALLVVCRGFNLPKLELVENDPMLKHIKFFEIPIVP